MEIAETPRKTTDALGRSLPWTTGEREPQVERFNLTEGDFVGFFEPLDRHYFLPSHYLLRFQEPVRKPNNTSLNRLTAFCIGSKEDGKLLWAPESQKRQENRRSKHKVYGITAKTRRLLEARGTACAVRPRPGWFIHQLMQGCVAASFELTAPERGFRYISRSELLTSPKVGTAKNAKNPMAIPLAGGKTLVPDDIFALKNAEGKMRRFLLEVDRDTESMEPKDADRSGRGDTTYFKTKLVHYFEAMRAGTIKTFFGFTRPRILIVTTNQARRLRILRALHDLDDPELAQWFSVKEIAYFDYDWRVPPRVFDELVKEEWETVNGPADILAPSK